MHINNIIFICFLVDITAETRVVTRSLPKFARQTHNVHDLRAQVADVFDLMQLKSNNNIVSDRIVEVSRIESGKDNGMLLIHYETPDKVYYQYFYIDNNIDKVKSIYHTK